MADRGENPHGEVDFVERYAPTSVLDAGCGTGRVGIEFARRGVDVVGTDLDASMLSTAQEKAPELTWVQSDLAALDLGRTFDAVVMAGNIILFVQPGTEAAVVAGAARHVGQGGHLIAGFSLNRGVTADEWDQWCSDAGLTPHERFATWDAAPWTPESDYLVAIATR